METTASHSTTNEPDSPERVGKKRLFGFMDRLTSNQRRCLLTDTNDDPKAPSNVQNGAVAKHRPGDPSQDPPGTILSPMAHMMEVEEDTVMVFYHEAVRCDDVLVQSGGGDDTSLQHYGQLVEMTPSSSQSFNVKEMGGLGFPGADLGESQPNMPADVGQSWQSETNSNSQCTVDIAGSGSAWDKAWMISSVHSDTEVCVTRSQLLKSLNQKRVGASLSSRHNSLLL